MADTVLTGWGRTAPSVGRLHTPVDTRQIADVIAGPARAVIARGLGRSYGDCAQSAGGAVLSSAALGAAADVVLDQRRGTAVVGAGVSLDDLLRLIVPQGWFVPVTPGTRFVTIGGAVAADVHGKNHHVDGAFGQHLNWVELVDGTGATRRLTPTGDTPDGDPPAFWATVGGLGLTGVITRVELRLRAIESSWMSVDVERAPDLETLTARLREHDGRRTYTVAWIDALASGSRLGRGVITSGEHACAATARAHGVGDPTAYHPRVRLTAPRMPVGLVTTATARAFNEAWFRKAPRRAEGVPQRLQAFFHPLDGVRDWNRVYGPHGVVQYQFVVPDEREDVLERALLRLQAAQAPSFLTVLKRFGPGDPGPLSFPRQGWTLAVDLPATGGDRLAAALDSLDLLVADAGGAVYLVKDARCRPELVPAMYPRLPEWRAARDRLDPDHRFASDLSRRLGL